MRIYDLINDINEEYINSGLVEDKQRFLSNAQLLVDNGLGYKKTGVDYDTLYQVTLQETSVAILYMMKFDKSLKRYLIKRDQTSLDDPILSVNKLMKKMVCSYPSQGFYMVDLDKGKSKTYMILNIVTNDNGGYEYAIYFIGKKWLKEKEKYMAYRKKYVDIIKDLKYEMIYYTDGQPPRDIKFKSFDKMVFHNKDKILEYIDNWINNIPKFYELEIPCKLSILLYGVPGTGKSTFAQALAKYMGIDTVRLVSTDYFENDVKLNKFNSCVLLLDDIDSFTVNREDEKSDIKSNNILGKILAFLDNPPTFNYKTKDGKVFPISIVIATTNYLDKLDIAIKRYGRFDCKFEMTDLTEKEADELCHMYDLSLYDVINKEDIQKDALYSPAYIQALCMSNLDKRLKEK